MFIYTSPMNFNHLDDQRKSISSLMCFSTPSQHFFSPMIFWLHNFICICCDQHNLLYRRVPVRRSENDWLSWQRCGVRINWPQKSRSAWWYLVKVCLLGLLVIYQLTLACTDWTDWIGPSKALVSFQLFAKKIMKRLGQYTKASSWTTLQLVHHGW